LPDTEIEDLLKKGQPLWWVHRLEERLDARASTLQQLDDYVAGKHPLAFATDRFREVFGGLFVEFADNWCDLVNDAVRERLGVKGFRLGDSTDSDTEVWRIWQANHLDADSQIAHSELLKLTECSALVWSNPLDEKTPKITIESPFETIVAFAPGSRRDRLAALKRWEDDDGVEQATLYLPDGLYKFSATGDTDVDAEEEAAADEEGLTAGSRWRIREIPDSETWPLANPLGVVPMVTMFNKPRLRPRDSLGLYGEAEHAKVIPIQDGINKTMMDMFVASEFGSFRQRYVTGLELATDPETGKRIEAFEAAMERLWATKNKDAKFGEFEATDLGNFVKAIEMLVQHTASQTRTPPHYFYLKGEMPSGESIKSAETGLVAKAYEKMLFLGEDWEEVMGLALKTVGSEAPVTSETIWGDPEYRTESEHIDALLKLGAMGVPQEILWEKAGFSQTEIRRIKRLIAERGLIEGLARPDVPEPPAGT
jgi:hypothetical protein